MQNNQSVAAQPAPSLIKLGACFIYEALVVIAILFMCALFFLILFGDAAQGVKSHGVKRYLFQCYLWLSVGVYFVWCWHKSGQTLAMQTWRLKLLTQDEHLLSVPMAMARYGLATMSLLMMGFGFMWAIVDRDHLFLHDRLLKNKLIYR